MMLRLPHRVIVDAAETIVECRCSESSLPSAGFRLYRACDPIYRAIGMFTTHRAEPSWT